MGGFCTKPQDEEEEDDDNNNNIYHKNNNNKNDIEQGSANNNNIHHRKAAQYQNNQGRGQKPFPSPKNNRNNNTNNQQQQQQQNTKRTRIDNNTKTTAKKYPLHTNEQQQQQQQQRVNNAPNSPTIARGVPPPPPPPKTPPPPTSPYVRRRKANNTIRASLVRVGSRIFNNINPLASSMTSSSSAVPSSPAVRVSNYNHVQDVVAINFQEAVSERGKHAVPLGIVGFRNMGNTCYMNSSLQCLSATIPLTDYFLGYDYRSEINHTNPLGTGGKIATEYAQLMKLMWLGAASNTNNHTLHNTSNRSVIEPIDFKRTLEKFATQFRGNNQNDSQELLAYLLDGIHEDLNRIKKKPYIEDKDCNGDNDENDAIVAWKNYLCRNKSLIVDLFQGQLRNELQCLTCHHINVRFEPFMYLSVPIAKGSNSNHQPPTLQDCLRLYLRKEHMTGDNQWYCSKCKQHRDATKKIDLWVLPPILIVHLKRFHFQEDYSNPTGLRGSKNTVPIQYPLSNWDLSLFVKSRGSEKPMYNLYAISNHIGGLGSGHYTAYTQNRFDDKWYEFNDSQYRIISQDEMQRPDNTRSAYVLFYNRINGTVSQPSSTNGSTNNKINPNDSPGSQASLNSVNRVPLIRRQSVSRPDLWPHTQVLDNQFREFSRSVRIQLPKPPLLSGSDHKPGNNTKNKKPSDDDDNDMTHTELILDEKYDPFKSASWNNTKATNYKHLVNKNSSDDSDDDENDIGNNKNKSRNSQAATTTTNTVSSDNNEIGNTSILQQHPPSVAATATKEVKSTNSPKSTPTTNYTTTNATGGDGINGSKTPHHYGSGTTTATINGTVQQPYSIMIGTTTSTSSNDSSTKKRKANNSNEKNTNITRS